MNYSGQVFALSTLQATAVLVMLASTIEHGACSRSRSVQAEDCFASLYRVKWMAVSRV